MMTNRRFTLDEAEALMPQVQEITQAAVQRVEAIVGQLAEIGEPDMRARRTIALETEQVVQEWAASITALGAEAKGLWLVDFDCGEGYYCWRYPEPSLEFFHSYDAGFAGRRPIAPPTLH